MLLDGIRAGLLLLAALPSPVLQQVVDRSLSSCCTQEIGHGFTEFANWPDDFRDLRQWPKVSDFVARFCTLCKSNNTRPCENRARMRESRAKRARFSHGHVLFVSRNVQKSVTQIIYLWPKEATAYATWLPSCTHAGCLYIACSFAASACTRYSTQAGHTASELSSNPGRVACLCTESFIKFDKALTKFNEACTKPCHGLIQILL